MPITAEDLEQEFQEEQAKRTKAKNDAASKLNEHVRVPRQCRLVLVLGIACAVLMLVLPWPAYIVRLSNSEESGLSADFARSILDESQPAQPMKLDALVASGKRNGAKNSVGEHLEGSHDNAHVKTVGGTYEKSEEVEANVESWMPNFDPARFGKERFAEHIEEFLRSAERSPSRKARCDRMRVPIDSNCPDWRWLTRYNSPEKEGRSPVFVDIGCNKGYSVATFFEHFAPTSNVTKATIYKGHETIGTPKACGVCQDCREPIKLGRKTSSHHPIVYCIDASRITHNRTKTVANAIKAHSPQAHDWQLFWQAMSNRTGVVKFQDCQTEQCSIDRGEGGPTVLLPVYTYDDFAKSKQLEFVDLVKIDAEGEEPLIIQGMHESLKSQKIGFIAFETAGYSLRGWWHNFDIRRIADLFDAYGYDCYVDSHCGKKGLALLTGCHDSRFEQSYANKKFPPKWYLDKHGVIPQWGNAICGLRRNTEIRGILKELSQA